MKVRYILVIGFFLLIHSASAQEHLTINDICSGKWHLEFIEKEGTKTPLSAEDQEDNWVNFTLDGKYEVMEDGEVYFGTWEYVEKDKMIKTYDRHGEVDQKVIKIVDGVMVVSIEGQDGKMLMGMKK